MNREVLTVRAGEAAWRTGLAGDAASMIQMVLETVPSALDDDGTENINLEAFIGSRVSVPFGEFAIVESGENIS